ncbi:dihydrofolate reductase [Metaclostridioides mangenotii]|uniref:dihydrofolate reductase n=1 Tax=Metaclostridioides mangenotii TaxID=1540 RepID=UPI000B035D56|nr:dihydrofolate reductase [Clostridioides mangenotii]
MGRTTFDSLPGKQPLKDRTNIVLTKNKSFQNDGVIVLNSVEEVLEEVKKYSEDEVYIIGGEMIYKQFLPYCKEHI